MTLVALATIPFCVVIQLVARPALQARPNKKFSHGAESQSCLIETTIGIATVVKSAAVGLKLQNCWEKQLARSISASFQASNWQNIAGQAATFANKPSMLTTLRFGARDMMANRLIVGQLVAFDIKAAKPVRFPMPRFYVGGL